MQKPETKASRSSQSSAHKLDKDQVKSPSTKHQQLNPCKNLGTFCKIFGFLFWLGVLFYCVLQTDNHVYGTSYHPQLTTVYDDLDNEWKQLSAWFIFFLIYILGYLFLQFLMMNRYRHLSILISGLIYTAFLVRYGSVLYAGIAVINFLITKLLSSVKLFPQLIWIVHCININFIYIFDGYEYIWPDQNLSAPFQWNKLYVWGMLRMISFSIDSHNCNGDSEKLRFLPYMAYIFYPPLFFSGPLITFSEWASQIEQPLMTKQIHHSAIKSIIAIGLIYIINVTSFGYSLTNHLGNEFFWKDPSKWIDKLYGISLMIMTLFTLWLKMTAIWCIQQQWASVDNIEVESNVTKIMFQIESSKDLANSFNRSLRSFMKLYIMKSVGSQNNKALSIIIVYVIMASIFDADQYNIFFFMTACLLNILEESISSNLLIQTAFKTISQYVLAFTLIAGFGSTWSIFSLLTHSENEQYGWIIPLFLFCGSLLQIQI